MQPRRHRLDNGLQVVLQADHTLPLVALSIWYHVGSKDEQPGRTGLAHLFEHMLFQGSENVGANDHFGHLQRAGGVANGSTWFDRTNYYETVPAHELELALWLESDRMGFLLPALTAEKLENQRSVVINERRQRVDNQPYGRASERLHELLYPADHPYHWPVIGYVDDIAAASLDEVEDFFHAHYAPNNAVLTLVGDFDEERALRMVDDYFGPLEPTARPSRSWPAPPYTAPVRRFEVLEDRVRLPRLYAGFSVPAYGTSEWYAASVLASILGGGRASRLYRDLVYQRQIAQSASCYVLPTELCGTFGMVISGRPDTHVDELRIAIDESLAEVVAHGVTEAERTRALNTMLTVHWNDLQALEDRADALSMATTYFDRPERALVEPEHYRAVTLEDLRACADRYGSASAHATVAVVPGEAPS